jgi:copper chaperone CopZ
MTCAHIVDVALKRTPGVESVNVSLDNGLATVKLKPGNTASVPQFWQVLHQKGYTPKTTIVFVRGELAGGPGRLQLKVSGTRDTVDLTRDPKNAAAYDAAAEKAGQTVVIQGFMAPGKDLKALAPLQVSQVN